MKLLLILTSAFFLFSLACGNNDKEIYEPIVSQEKIEFPFTERDDGRFMTLFRNNGLESVPITILLVSDQKVMENSQSLDFCDGVVALRNGKSVLEWSPINFNHPIVPEKEVVNANDHPNVISYNLPKGTYVIMLMDSETCSRDNYVTFDIKTNDAIGK